MSVVITVLGVPVPQGSKSVGIRGGRAVMWDDNRALAGWRDTVAAACRAQKRITRSGPHVMRATFTMPRPLSHHRADKARTLREDAPDWHAVRPDLDKLLRAVCDGLTAGGIWCDDAMLAEVTGRKVYPGAPMPDVLAEPGVVIRLDWATLTRSWGEDNTEGPA